MLQKSYIVNAYFLLLVTLFLISSSSLQAYESYIVKLKAGKSAAQFVGRHPADRYSKAIALPKSDFDKNITAKLLSADPNQILLRLETYLVIANNGKNESFIIDTLSNDPDVEYVEPNFIFRVEKLDATNDPLFKDQWGMTAVNAVRAWQKATGKGIRIGIVDTGIDPEHPDLKNQLAINKAEDINHNGRFDPWPSNETRNNVTGDLNGTDDDGNGFTDDVIGYDFISQEVANIGDASNPDPLPLDEHGHGTSIAGVIAAERNNREGITGLAFDSRLVILRAMDATGNGESDDIARAVVYAALNNIKVINLSFGETYDSQLMHDAIRFAASMGCIVIASSGNNGWDKRHYPSDYPEVISVGAMNIDFERDYFSNYGSLLALVAPGSGIISTQIGGGYKQYNGTSLAAPFVSAAAALLLELDSNLTYTDIKTILQSSARDIDRQGWDVYTGSGLLDAASSLENIARGKVEFSYPANQSLIIKNRSNKMILTGTIALPLFEKYSILVGRGDTPFSWDTVSRGNTQVLESTLSAFNYDKKPDGKYTARILITLKNNGTYEKRVQFELLSANKRLVFDTLLVSYPWFNDKRCLLVSAATNIPSRLIVNYRQKGSTESYITASNQDRTGNFHAFKLNSPVEPGMLYEARAVAITENGDSTFSSFEFRLPADFMPIDRFRQKSYNLPPAYIKNDVINFYGGNRDIIALNDLSSGSWGQTKTYEFNSGIFLIKDSSRVITIPSGLGDSNGDGINEVLTFGFGRSFLYQGKDVESNPFTKVLFGDSTSFNFWATDLHDMNKDGKKDIIAYSDTSFFFFTESGGKYSLVAQTDLNKPYKYIGTSPGYTAADFEGDGFQKLCHGNNAGQLFVHKFQNGRLSLIFADTSEVADDSPTITSGDIDGDGTPEIIVLKNGSNLILKDGDYPASVWKLSIYKYANNSFDKIFSDFIYGVRSGIGYRNGVSAGDIDGSKGDEILVSTFPNLYIFKWNQAKMSTQPFYWYPSSFTSSILIHDFDHNNINEFAFNTGARTIFLEYAKDFAGPDLPTGFDGWALDENSAYLHWQPVTNAAYYEIYKLISDSQAEKIAETSSNEITVSLLDNYTKNRFLLRSVDTSTGTSYSDWSDVVTVYTHPRIFGKKAEGMNNSVLLHFTGKLPDTEPEAYIFTLLDSNKQFLAFPRTVQKGADSVLILTFDDPVYNSNFIWHKSFPDFYRTPSLDYETRISANMKESEKELYLSRLDILSSTGIRLVFSEPVTAESAALPGNYSLNPIADIIAAEPTANLDAVILSLNPQHPLGALGKNYILTAKNITAQSGHQMTKGPGCNLAFVFSRENGSDAFVYPNPARLNTDIIFFANLPRQAEVQILKQDGELIRTLVESDGNGGVEWDGLDFLGNKLSSGIYLFKVRTYLPNGSYTDSEMKKFAILP